MSSKETLYANLADRIVRLNEEMIKFTRQAEATQQVVAKASEVTTLYYNMFVVNSIVDSVGLSIVLLLNNFNSKNRMYRIQFDYCLLKMFKHCEFSNVCCLIHLSCFFCSVEAY